MAKAKTPRLTTNSSKQVITMPEGGSPLSLRKSGTATAPTPIDLESQIRLRAYELYQERGCAPGRENEDWLRAEREVLARHGRQQTVSA